LETDQTGVDVELNNETTRTPSLPEDLLAIELSDNAHTVLVKRYIRRGEDGQPSETVEEMFWRVAYNVALVEEEWDVEVESVARDFYELITSKRFFPNSPTFTGAGTPLGQLAACFVLPIADDMGRDSEGIFQTLRDAALIQQTGGGNGFSFSRLRPNGDLVNSSRGEATGRPTEHIANSSNRMSSSSSINGFAHANSLIKSFSKLITMESQVSFSLMPQIGTTRFRICMIWKLQTLAGNNG
jgi:hypothetical protein